jgi:hypothetical protein
LFLVPFCAVDWLVDWLIDWLIDRSSYVVATQEVVLSWFKLQDLFFIVSLPLGHRYFVNTAILDKEQGF